jgi:hypothetical protein
VDSDSTSCSTPRAFDFDAPCDKGVAVRLCSARLLFNQDRGSSVRCGTSCVASAPREVLCATHRPAVVLSGLAGAGKTAALRTLSERGACILDLEGLARHRGSAFGEMTGLDQPSHEAFSHQVMEVLVNADSDRVLWLEEERPFIGSVGLPPDGH